MTPPGLWTGWARTGTAARGGGVDRKWDEDASGAGDGRVKTGYARGGGGFWSPDAGQQGGSPADTSGWALSMIGPAELARRGVDVPAMVADLGRIPGGVVVT